MIYKLRFFIPLALVITALSGLIYLTGQQTLRQGANDPQIQTSEDVAYRLSANPALPRNSPGSIDITKSLAVFIIIYDDKGSPIFSTAKISDKTPTIPSGVFDYARTHNQSRITWQPRPGVRNAVVITRFTGKSKGFVLAGRSLREVEKRVNQLTGLVAIGWILAMIGTLLATIIFVPGKSKKQK